MMGVRSECFSKRTSPLSRRPYSLLPLWLQSYACLLTSFCLQTYVTNINAQVDKFPELKDLGLVTLNQSIGTSKIPKEANTAVR